MLRPLAATVRAAAACSLLLLAPVLAQAGELEGYKIVSVDGEPAARKVTVRIESRLGEQAVKDLAAAIGAKAKSGERIAGVTFYLPGIELTQQPWATARIDGSAVQINVLGLRAEEEAAFRSEAEKDERDVVGVWLTSPPALPGKLTILRAAKGRFVAEWHLRSGQKTTDELTMARVSRGTRYDVVGGDGAYYLAAWNGSLQLGDATRIIATAEKLVIEKKAAPVAANKKDPAAKVQAAAVKDAADPSASGSAAPVLTGGAGAAAAAVPTRAVQRSRSAKASQREKSRSSVADLISGSVAR